MIILIELLMLVIRVIFRHAMFNEIRRSLGQRNGVPQQYEPLKPTPKIPLSQAMLAKANQLIQKSPQSADGYCDRAAVYMLLKQYDQALVDLKKAIWLQTDYADAFNNRAVLHYRQNNFQEAINDFNTAIRYDASDAYYHLNRAMAYKRLEDNLKAETDIEKALDLSLKLVDTADKANSKQHVIDENIIWNRQLAHMVFIKTELLFVKYNHHEHLDNAVII